MDMVATLLSLVACLGVAGACGWRGARPPDLHRGPRLFPYRLVMVLAGAGALLMLVHLVNLAGVATGRG
jgi:hypothetical protein